MSCGTMELEMTLEDPKGFTKPIAFRRTLRLLPDTDLVEYKCSEDEKGLKYVVVNLREAQVYTEGMQDLKLDAPATDEVQVDSRTLEAIDCGAQAADEGRTVSIEEARKLIPEWISKFASQTRR